MKLLLRVAAASLVVIAGCSKPAFESIDAKLIDAKAPAATVKAAAFPAATAKPALTLTGHKEKISALAYSPDGQFLASGGYGDNMVRLWNASTGALLGDASSPHRISSLAWLPDGSAVVVANVYGQLGTYRATSAGLAPPQIVETPFKENGGIQQIAISPNGKLLAAIGWPKPILLWDLAAAKTLRLIGPDRQLHAVAFSDSGDSLAVVGKGPAFQVINLRSRTESSFTVDKVDATSDGNAIAYAPGGKYLGVGFNDCTFAIWRTPALKELHNHFINPGSVMGMAFSPDGSQLATIQAGLGVYVWESETRTLQGSFMHKEQIDSIAFRPDGSALAVGIADGRIVIYR